MLFNGSCTALCVPYTKDGINFEEYKRIIRFQIESGTDAIVVNGTTGEPSTMTDKEKTALVSVAVKACGGKIPVYAGVGGNNTASCVSLARAAEDAGASGVLCVTPYYNKCTRKGLIAHFTAVADAGRLPVILYNVPSRTNVNITTETAEILSRHKNIAAIKEACGDIAQIKNTIDAVGKNMLVYSGNDDQNTEIIKMGGRGVISVASNIIPEYIKQNADAALKGDTKKADEMQKKANPLISALFCEVNPIPVKTAMRMMGFDMGIFRLPLCEMEEDTKERLISEMKSFGIL